MIKQRRLAAGLFSFGLMMMSHAAWAIPFDQIHDAYPVNPPDVSHVPDAKPVPLPYSKYGNPENYDVNGVHYHVLSTSKGYHQSGFASWYGTKFQGRRTSSGEPYNMYAMTAASTTLPIPSFVRVTNIQNGKSVIVKVNDRGPFHTDRIMDLSYAAAARLDILQHGTAPVRVDAIDTSSGNSSDSAVTSIYDLRADSTTNIDQHHATNDFGESILVHGYTHANNGRTFVQVASFTKSTNAHKLADNLRDYVDKPVSINQVPSANGNRYRVLIGPLDSTYDAQTVQTSLRRDGLGNGVVVQA